MDLSTFRNYLLLQDKNYLNYSINKIWIFKKSIRRDIILLALEISKINLRIYLIMTIYPYHLSKGQESHKTNKTNS